MKSEGLVGAQLAIGVQRLNTFSNAHSLRKNRKHQAFKQLLVLEFRIQDSEEDVSFSTIIKKDGAQLITDLMIYGYPLWSLWLLFFLMHTVYKNINQCLYAIM